MKTLIVSAGILMLGLTVVSYHGDYQRYTRLQRALDDAAFECAEFAASSADAEEAQAFADELLGYTINKLGNIRVSDYSCDVSLTEEFAQVCIKADASKLFRLPFLTKAEITAGSRRERLI